MSHPLLPRSSRSVLLAAPAFAGALLLAAPSQATHYATAYAYAGGVEQNVSGFFFAEAADSGSSGDGFSIGSGAASASVALGLLHMDAFGTGSGYGGGGGTANGSFADELTFSSATLNGQPGYFHMTFYVHGGLSASEAGPYGGSGSASFRATLSAESPAAAFSDSVDSSAGYSVGGGIGGGGGYDGDALPALLEMTVPFVFGDPFSIGFFMQAGAVGGGNGSGPPNGGSASADFSDTAFWGGVPEVFTDDGSSVTDFVLTSESGVDYRPSFDDAGAVAAPEPAFGLGFGGAVLALLLRRARRRASTSRG